MGCFSASLLVGLALQADPPKTEAQPAKYALGWTFQAGQTRELAWGGRFKIEAKLGSVEQPPTEVEFSWTGTLAIESVGEDGAGTGELRLHHQAFKGVMSGSKPMDILVEDSKLKRPEGPIPEEAKKMIDAILAPAKVKVTRRGYLEFLRPHPMLSNGAGPWPAMVGPILPWKKQVAVGDSWIGKLQTPEQKAAGEQGFDAEYTFVEMTEVNSRKCARLTMKTTQSMRFQGAESTFSVKSNALFDPERGECMNDHLSGEVKGGTTFRGEQYVFSGTFAMDFSTQAPK